MDIFSQFGVEPSKFLIQSLVFLVPTLWATIRVIQHRFGVHLAGWLFFIWFFPFIGSIAALFMVTAPKKQNE